MTIAYLSTGSNLDRRLRNLDRTIRELNQHPHIQVLRASAIYETEPWGYQHQPSFLNQVLEIETDLSPLELVKTIKGMEADLGRTPTFKYGPRVIDIDIIFYGDLVFEDETLNIPHPQVTQRAFVLVPMAELAPDFVHPELGLKVSELLQEIDTRGITRFSEAGGSLADDLCIPHWGERTYVMGILNITPDSFSGDGLMQRQNYVAAALEQAYGFIEAGVDILDIGAESTRPGAQTVDTQDEIERLIPVVEALSQEHPDVLLSIDTYKAAVAEAALDAGGHWINDVWGLRADPEMANTAARAGVPIVLMHNRSRPTDVNLQERLGGRYVGVAYEDLIEDVKRELLDSVAIARQAGVKDENIILDPGIGFGKTVEQNLELLNRLDEIAALSFPLLLGSSRKSFIGYTLGLPPEQRVEGTAATVAVGIVRGADIVRVHDVKTMVRVARMTDAIVRRRS
jgi:dihydropteroate synthase/2-amino-4-hydroxy-6-hydroxymethyldihydropteridine diphosphokinase